MIARLAGHAADVKSQIVHQQILFSHSYMFLKTIRVIRQFLQDWEILSFYFNILTHYATLSIHSVVTYHTLLCSCCLLGTKSPSKI